MTGLPPFLTVMIGLPLLFLLTYLVVAVGISVCSNPLPRKLYKDLLDHIPDNRPMKDQYTICLKSIRVELYKDVDKSYNIIIDNVRFVEPVFKNLYKDIREKSVKTKEVINKVRQY